MTCASDCVWLRLKNFYLRNKNEQGGSGILQLAVIQNSCNVKITIKLLDSFVSQVLTLTYKFQYFSSQYSASMKSYFLHTIIKFLNCNFVESIHFFSNKLKIILDLYNVATIHKHNTVNSPYSEFWYNE